MPARKIPDKEKEIRQNLREVYGGSMSINDVACEISVRDNRTALKWLEGVEFFTVGRSRRYRVEDIAQRIYWQLQ